MLTFAWLVVDADGLGLVLAILRLHADEVGVGRFVETRPHGQDVVVGLVQHLHQLRRDKTGWEGWTENFFYIQTCLALNCFLRSEDFS